jgi:hypothetical protein
MVLLMQVRNCFTRSELLTAINTNITVYDMRRSVFRIFSDAASNSAFMASNGSNTYERTWKEPVVAYFRCYTGLSLESLYKTTEMSDSRRPGRDSNQAPPECKTEALLLETTCHVTSCSMAHTNAPTYTVQHNANRSGIRTQLRKI